ncbi:hypothetical protein LTR78_008497 [Recurvomyces mirabilis]|uniref:Uncharacterized protein n=1 Tax=Recurvomyces mirabilis TaxID=574656 RepID=A0AAE0TTK8_9PEZI|nr:hypothetical protein LTR78_008497 [Recurvomyces mirabilis]KAK5156249.1 hypothetical protein LTS14_005136 [Recurvomyces mirabilis]
MAGNPLNLLGDYGTFANSHVDDLKLVGTNDQPLDSNSTTNDGDFLYLHAEDFKPGMFPSEGDAKVIKEFDASTMFPHGHPIPVYSITKAEYAASPHLDDFGLESVNMCLSNADTPAVSPAAVVPYLTSAAYPASKGPNPPSAGRAKLTRNVSSLNNAFPISSRPIPNHRLRQKSSFSILQSKQKRKFDELDFDNDVDAIPPFRTLPTSMPGTLPDAPRGSPSGIVPTLASRAQDAIREMRAGCLSPIFADKARQAPQSRSPTDFVDSIENLTFRDRGPAKKKSKRTKPSSTHSSAPRANPITTSPIGIIPATAMAATMPATTTHQPAAIIPSLTSTSRPLSEASTKTLTPYAKKLISTGHLRNAGYVSGFDDIFAPRENARLPDCKMSATEILYFFPRHTQWPDIMLRLLGNGFNSSTMADGILYYRGRLDLEHHERRDAAQRRQVCHSGKEKFGDSAWKSSEATAAEVHPVTDYNVSSATLPSGQHATILQSLKLVDVARGVQ